MSQGIPITPAGSRENGSSSTKETTSRSASDQSRGETTKNRPGTDVRSNSSEEKEPPGEEELRETTELLNKSAQVLNRDLRFNVLPEEDLVQAEVVNRETDEVIQKIPPDELVEVRKKIDAFLGLFIDEKR